MGIGQSMRIHVAGSFKSEQPCFFIHLGEKSVVASLWFEFLALVSYKFIVLGPVFRFIFVFQLPLPFFCVLVSKNKDIAGPSS